MQLCDQENIHTYPTKISSGLKESSLYFLFGLAFIHFRDMAVCVSKHPSQMISIKRQNLHALHSMPQNITIKKNCLFAHTKILKRNLNSVGWKLGYMNNKLAKSGHIVPSTSVTSIILKLASNIVFLVCINISKGNQIMGVMQTKILMNIWALNKQQLKS